MTSSNHSGSNRDRKQNSSATRQKTDVSVVGNVTTNTRTVPIKSEIKFFFHLSHMRQSRCSDEAGVLTGSTAAMKTFILAYNGEMMSIVCVLSAVPTCAAPLRDDVMGVYEFNYDTCTEKNIHSHRL